MESFQDIKVPETIERLKNDPGFEAICNHYWPEANLSEIKNSLNGIKTAQEFQLKFMHSIISKIIEKSSGGFTFSGIDKLDPKESYLFIANHRDILLDTAIMQVILVENGHETSEITFGDNLMQPGLVTDLCNLNRMLTVKRTGTTRELYSYSKELSEYVRKVVTANKNSIWLAQRGGRTKDGLDLTQPGLLKMLNMTGGDDLVKNYNELNIIPLSISFEYEPCDDLKTMETYSKIKEIPYVKGEDEDMESIKKGILEDKGRIHMHFGNKIVLQEEQEKPQENAFLKNLAKQIDQSLYSGYKLWPTNYMAADLLAGDQTYSKEYTATELEHFNAYLTGRIANLKGEKELLLETILKVYANPVLAVNRTEISV